MSTAKAPIQLPHDIEAALFDFDGTLIDASRAIISAFNNVLPTYRIPPVEDDVLIKMIGRPLTEMFERVGIAPSDIPSCVSSYRQAFLPVAASLSSPLPTVAETLPALSKAGVRLAVVTTRTADGARYILEGLHLLEYFEYFIGLEHVEHPKPDPEPVVRALTSLRVAPNKAIMVGDTPDDVAAGNAAGTWTVGVTSGIHDAEALREAGADFVIEELAELPPLLALDQPKPEI